MRENKKRREGKENSLVFSCDPVGTRTQDPQLRRLLLYPAELPDLHVVLHDFEKSTAKLVIFSQIDICLC